MKFLLPEDVLAIVARCEAGEAQYQVARDFAISQATVSGIITGQHWNQVTGKPRKRPLTPRQQRVLAIYSAYWEQKLPVAHIAGVFGVSKTNVYDIRDGRVGAKLTGHPQWKDAAHGLS